MKTQPAAARTSHSKWTPPPGPYRVFVSTPCDDGHKLCFWDSIRALERASIRGETRNSYRIHTTHGDSLIPRGRNNHLHYFYHHTADDWFLPIDSDLDFRTVDPDMLFENPGPIMAGLYAIKEANLRWCLNTLPGHAVDPVTRRQFVATAGTGFLAIHRHVVGTLITEAHKWKAWPILYNDDTNNTSIVADLFHNGVVRDDKWFPTQPTGRYLSEDWGFCYLARKHGFTITADHRVVALHEGSIKYPLQARRLDQAETAAGVIQQPDGTQTAIPK